MNRAKLIAIAAAAVAMMGTGAPTSRLPFLPAASQFNGWRGGRHSGGRGRGWGGKNDKARELGIPKAFRQYARRYGSDVQTLELMHLRCPAPMLNHLRDKIEAAHRALDALHALQGRRA